MVVLADELLENFFGTDLSASFQLTRVADEDYHQAQAKSEGLLGGLMNLVVNDRYVLLYRLHITTNGTAETDTAVTRTASTSLPTLSAPH